MSKVFRAIDSLKFDPANARKHDERNIKAIMDSLRMHGQRKPVVLYSDMIVAGNGTVAAAKRLGWTEVWVNNDPFESLEAAKAYALQDNRSAELAAWDHGVLDETITELKEKGWDIEALGWNDVELKEFESESNGNDGLTDPDEVPEIEKNTYGVKRGDIWQLGNHRIMCGDSTNRATVEKLMNGEKADMVFTDPPYGMNLDVEYDKMFSKGGDHTKTGARFKKVEGDDRDYDPAHIFEMFKCDKFLWGCDYYYDKLPKGGCFLAWDKRDENLDKVPGNPTEFCWSDKPRRRMSFRIKWSGHHGMQKDDTKKRVHPTQKPAALVEAFFEQWGKGKNLVVDLFLGSGSTLIACEKTGRKCYGMELDEHYCSVIIKRWEDFTGKKAEKISEAA